jgi:predicted dehydrogenase
VASDGRLRFGVLGTGSIAAEFVDALASSRSCEAMAVASRDAGRAEAFALRHGIGASYGDYPALLGDPRVDIVYVATPHPQHAEWAIAAAGRGKHVLCEKPLTMDRAEAEAVVAAADRNGVFLMEAFAYRFHPQTHRLLELIREGAIGQVRAIDVTFAFGSEDAVGGRLLARELGGGGILDVGCYCVSMSRQIVAAASGATTVEPVDVMGMASLDPVEGTDRYAMAILRFDGDVLAQLSCAVTLTQDDHVRVYGTHGHLHVPWPCWLGGRRDAASQIILTRPGDEPEAIDIRGGESIFALEADGVAALLREGVDTCRPSWDDTLANMRTLDRWRAAVGA